MLILLRMYGKRRFVFDSCCIALDEQAEQRN